MKRAPFFFALIGIVFLAGIAMGQLPGTPTYSMVIDRRPSSAKETVRVKVPATGGAFTIFEGAIPASSESECFASRDFSAVGKVGPARAHLTYDATTKTNTLRWTVEQSSKERCRVLLVRGAVPSGDLTIWQGNYGSPAAYSVEPGIVKNLQQPPNPLPKP